MTGDRVVDPATTLAAALLSIPVITARSPEDAARKRAAHQLAMLADAGFIVLALPKPIERAHTIWPDMQVDDYLGNRSRTQITVDPEGGRRKDGTPRGEWIVQEMRGASGQQYRATDDGFHFIAALLAALTEAAKRNAAAEGEVS